ncbi:MAG: ATP-binding protein, partial [Proteobacteria bacterium]|nr:ATP-binding protein [Pseudomonadota bacterium]
MMLSEAVSIARRFRRSIRLDTDIGTQDALSGFICHGSSASVLETMAQLICESGQRAFTWTGPYGGGKSSLALALACYVSPDRKIRRAARKMLAAVPHLAKALPASDTDWLTIPVTGRRGDPVADIDAALTAATATKTRARAKKSAADARSLIARLDQEAAARRKGGVLLLIDEMGKFLEGSTADGPDIYFFQELAEAANRSKGRFIVIGVLHQAFAQYAARLGREARDEWAKVQGRYVDIPVVTAIDEVIDLVGRAIVTDHPHPESLAIAETVAAAIKHRRPGTPDDLTARLDSCWPLHPVTAALLGPVTRRRFGQNERSTFGFLCSAEPEGLQDFLKGAAASAAVTYDPARLWDYLRINLEPAILASPDGHRWAQGAEAIERTEAKGTKLHIRLAKTIVLVDLFRNGSGVAPESAILRACLHGESEDAIERALVDLAEWSVIIFRKHLESWGVYAGSDFDIDTAVSEARATADLDLDRVTHLADLRPIPAKQHYHRTGTLRWFDTAILPLSAAGDAVKAFKPSNGATGKFILAIPSSADQPRAAKYACRKASQGSGAYPVAVGLPRNAWLLRELGAELIALENVHAHSPELEGDSVARREITARIAATSAQLEEELRSSFAQATWYCRGETLGSAEAGGLSRVVSELADTTFAKTPVIHSELVNREKPSSNSQAAVRELLHAMAENPNKPYCGIEGFPAERGLYSTVLEVSGLHRKQKDGTYSFDAPSAGKPGASFKPFWRKAEQILGKGDGIVPLSALYEAWTQPPFGVRRGLLPILALAFIQANRRTLAVYAEDVFRPQVDRYVVDLLFQSEKHIGLRRVALKAQNEAILRDAAKALAAVTAQKPAAEPLAVARGLVHLVFNLPPWTRRTSSLSEPALALRRVLLSADDPHRALFV